MPHTNNKNIDVLILCGGLGTRLRSVLRDRPKSMAVIGKKPFLDVLIEHTASFGFRRFILCAGYKADVIEKYYGQKSGGEEILVSREKTPLGTGGAVKNAEDFIKSTPFLVMNGDSLCRVKLDAFTCFHKKKKALVSLVLVNRDEAADYGSIEIEDSGRIIEFNEKINGVKKGLINAGIYLFDRSILPLMPPREKFSLEYDFFPKILDRRVYGYTATENFIDIGTPERLAIAKEVLGC